MNNTKKYKALEYLYVDKYNWTRGFIYDITTNGDSLIITSNTGDFHTIINEQEGILENFEEIILPKTKRKYLDDIGIPIDERSEDYCNEDDGRQPYWKKQRDTYGFDERETWSLDETFYLWLYERLKMYNEVNCVNTDFHKFEYKDKEISFQDCIDRMLEGLKLELTKDNLYEARTIEEEEKIEDILPIFTLCHRALWW